jgi:flagellar basal body-associated protein FliL
MAEEEEKEVAQTIKKSGGLSPKLTVAIVVGLAVAIIGISAAVGGFMARSATAAAAPAQTPQATQPAEEPAAGETKSDVQYTYYEMEPTIVNLDEPRLARYIRASIVLAVRGENFKAVSELVDKKKPELKSWLTVYLAGCSLEDVRGPKNLNRICREVREAFNEQLWPGGKPQIEKVLLKEFAVQ